MHNCFILCFKLTSTINSLDDRQIQKAVKIDSISFISFFCSISHNEEDSVSVGRTVRDLHTPAIARSSLNSFWCESMQTERSRFWCPFWASKNHFFASNSRRNQANWSQSLALCMLWWTMSTSIVLSQGELLQVGEHANPRDFCQG